LDTFEGKVALVTGATSGLGAATALAFARRGASVVVAGRRQTRGDEVVAQIEHLGGRARYVRTDVTVTADVDAMVRTTLAAFGRLDIAVNNAGIAGPSRTPAADVAEADWDAVMSLNLRAVWLCMKHEIPAILAGGGGGAIVNVASIYGLRPSDIGHAPYAASKFGVVGLTRSAAVDYGRSGLRINAVAPGFTRSEMVDPGRPGAAERYAVFTARHSAMNRLGEADEVADAITWLCGDGARFVNGAVLTVDGGETTRLY
jgi:NAD(P)-dependent dehydrogenase (short-subunit alcohol dehydrogenase family)